MHKASAHQVLAQGFTGLQSKTAALPTNSCSRNSNQRHNRLETLGEANRGDLACDLACDLKGNLPVLRQRWRTTVAHRTARLSNAAESDRFFGPVAVLFAFV